MKELHHHIFSNTTCISKETMLKHINNQLSKQELYEVEKHMLDCELCSDAYAGMQFAENSSMLFAIDNAIDKRAGAKNTKTPIMKNIMLAASVLVIVFGTYFSVNYFDKAVNNDQGLAINEEKVNELLITPDAAPIELRNAERNDASETLESEAPQINVEGNIPLSENRNKAPELPKTTVVEEVELDDLMTEDVGATEDFEVVANEAVLLDEMEEEVVEVEQRSVTDNVVVSADEVLRKEEKVVRSKSSSKKKNIFSIEASVEPAKILSNVPTKYKDKRADYMLTIEGFKVFDYKQEFQDAYDKKEADNFVTESVAAGYESKADKDIANKELEESIIEVTYKDALDDAMRLYKNKKYRDALQEFDHIEAKHPEEVNAQFYSGLCYFYLGQNAAAIKKFDKVLKNKQTEFNEEANWFKALTLLEMKSTTAAKKLLKTIVKTNGFYKAKAENKLEELK